MSDDEISDKKREILNKIAELDDQYMKILSKYGNIHTDVLFDVTNEEDVKKLNEITDKIIS